MGLQSRVCGDPSKYCRTIARPSFMQPVVAGGVPDRLPGHVEAIAELALEMIAETCLLRPDGEPLQIPHS